MARFTAKDEKCAARGEGRHTDSHVRAGNKLVLAALQEPECVPECVGDNKQATIQEELNNTTTGRERGDTLVDDATAYGKYNKGDDKGARNPEVVDFEQESIPAVRAADVTQLFHLVVELAKLRAGAKLGAGAQERAGRLRAEITELDLCSEMDEDLKNAIDASCNTSVSQTAGCEDGAAKLVGSMIAHILSRGHLTRERTACRQSLVQTVSAHVLELLKKGKKVDIIFEQSAEQMARIVKEALKPRGDSKALGIRGGGGQASETHSSQGGQTDHKQALIVGLRTRHALGPAGELRDLMGVCRAWDSEARRKPWRVVYHPARVSDGFLLGQTYHESDVLAALQLLRGVAAFMR